MSVVKKGIPPEDFYGGKHPMQDKIEALLRKEEQRENIKTPKFMKQLQGPSQTWKVFKKQQDAIDCCRRRRNGLMCFTFEDVNARRMFLVAHPKVFWSINSHRFFKNCSTYEIIQEFSACKLYLDIEYEYKYNSQCDGNRMLSNMIQIINFNLNFIFKVEISLSDILDLDSSSDVKFSHHIIYEIKNVAFQDNYAVGKFLKKICRELWEAFENNLSGDGNKLNELVIKYGLTKQNVLELFVFDNKGKVKLFVDEGVYTKNRHFRVLGSSKLGKNVSLVISKSNKYKPSQTSDSYECCLFLDSLVTYFSWVVNKVLEFEDVQMIKRIKSVQQNECETKTLKQEGEIESTIYPKIDSFINKIIYPNGRIRKKVYFSNSSTIVYDIQGFRYCDNIQREHKSNNIKYIVDLQLLGFYQKCYDPDCEHFRSNLKPLPDDIRFFFEGDNLFLEEGLDFDFPEFQAQDLIKFVDRIEKENYFHQNISDDDLGKIVDCTEEILDIKW